MSHWTRVVGLLLGAVIAAGCDADASSRSAEEPPPTSSAPPVPASLDHPLGSGTIRAGADSVLDALVQEISDAGGVRAELTGGTHDTTLELTPTSVRPFTAARRYLWQENGAAREQVQLPGGRLCVTRATGRALRSLGHPALGQLTAGARPYSCTGSGGSSVASLVSFGFRTYDPVTRLAASASAELTDLGLETDPAGATTRHLQIQIHELEAPFTYDLWIDGDLRILRAEYGAMTATFSYGGVPAVRLPAAAERGVLGFRAGTGQTGSYLGPRGQAPDTAE